MKTPIENPLGLMTPFERTKAADALSAMLAGDWQISDKAHAAAVRALLKLRTPDPARELLAALQPFVGSNSSEETITITVRTADVTRARAAITKASAA